MRSNADSMEQQMLRHPRYRYSGVFIDILVAIWFWLIVSGIAFATMPVLTVPFLVFFSFGTGFFAGFTLLIGCALLSRRRRQLFVWLNRWWPRHLFGLLMIGLPLGLAYFNLPDCAAAAGADSLSLRRLGLCATQLVLDHRLVFCYMMLIIIYAHCNFSQLCAWPKSAQGAVAAGIFVAFNW